MLKTADAFQQWERGKGGVPEIGDAPENLNADLKAMADSTPDR